jgi:hypothetical protein
MKVKAYKPKNEMLASLIDCYYLLSRDDSEPTTTYLTFPSVFSIHSIALNTKIVQVESRYIIQQDKQQSFLSEVVCRFNSALCFEYRGGVNEITIYFKPLGLNAFLAKDLSSYPEGITNSFISFLDLLTTLEADIFPPKLAPFCFNLLEHSLEQQFLEETVSNKFLQFLQFLVFNFSVLHLRHFALAEFAFFPILIIVPQPTQFVSLINPL